MNLPVLQGLVQQIDNRVLVFKDPELLGIELEDNSLVIVRIPHPIMPHDMHRLVGRRVLLCFPGDAEGDTDELPTHTEG
jgi:hypothetical protein